MSYDWIKSERELGPTGKNDFHEFLERSNIKYESLDSMILGPSGSRDIYFIVLNTNNPNGHGDIITDKRYPYEIDHIDSLFCEIKDKYFDEGVKMGISAEEEGKL